MSTPKMNPMEHATELEQDIFSQYAHLNYGFTLDRTLKRLRQIMQRQFNAHDFGITVEQFVVLDCLLAQNGLNQNEIADNTYKDAPTMTRILDQLQKKGLIRREADATDRRRFNIFLTEEARVLLERVHPVVETVRRQGWNGLSMADFQQLMRILNTIFNNLNQLNTSHPDAYFLDNDSSAD